MTISGDQVTPSTECESRGCEKYVSVPQHQGEDDHRIDGVPREHECGIQRAFDVLADCPADELEWHE